MACLAPCPGRRRPDELVLGGDWDVREGRVQVRARTGPGVSDAPSSCRVRAHGYPLVRVRKRGSAARDGGLFARASRGPRAARAGTHCAGRCHLYRRQRRQRSSTLQPFPTHLHPASSTSARGDRALTSGRSRIRPASAVLAAAWPCCRAFRRGVRGVINGDRGRPLRGCADLHARVGGECRRGAGSDQLRQRERTSHRSAGCSRRRRADHVAAASTRT